MLLFAGQTPRNSSVLKQKSNTNHARQLHGSSRQAGTRAQEQVDQVVSEQETGMIRSRGHVVIYYARKQTVECCRTVWYVEVSQQSNSTINNKALYEQMYMFSSRFSRRATMPPCTRKPRTIRSETAAVIGEPILGRQRARTKRRKVVGSRLVHAKRGLHHRTHFRGRPRVNTVLIVRNRNAGSGWISYLERMRPTLTSVY